jgi:hypothetical protein
MKTTELTSKEINLLIKGLYSIYSDEVLDNNPDSLAAKLIDKLYDAKQNENTNNDKK